MPKEINLEELKKKKTVRELLEFGIINIDKPSGPTSFQVSEFVKEKLKARKTSHFGTLDPKVSGVLPIAINRACRLTEYFIHHDKEYVGVMKLHKEMKLEDIQKTINQKFIGKIVQKPPVRSRVARVERQREIKKFELIEQDGMDILFHVECEGGTYIRKLIHDLGNELKIGSHMLELRRVRAGIFKETDEKYPSINLYEFEKAVKECEKGREESLKRMIIPAEIVSKLYPSLQVKECYVKRVLHGSPIYEKYIKPIKKEINGLVCAFAKEKFIGIYEIVNERGIIAKPKFVLQPID